MKDHHSTRQAQQINTSLAHRVPANVCCTPVVFYSSCVASRHPLQTSKAGRPLKVGKARLPPSKSMFTVYKGE